MLDMLIFVITLKLREQEHVHWLLRDINIEKGNMGRYETYKWG